MMYVLSLIGISFALCASEEKERQEKILKALNVPHLYALTAVLVPKYNLGNADFKTLLTMVPNPEHIDVSGNNISVFSDEMPLRSSLKSLDISNNSFTGEFPLQQCVRLFSNLEALKINGNKVTALLKQDELFTNNSLKTYEAHATLCQQINLSSLYNNLCLKTLDMSNSKQLDTFLELSNLCRKNTGTALLRVLLNNTIISADDMKQYEKQAGVHTKIAENIIGTMAFSGGGLGTIASFACLFMKPNYCMRYPIPGEDIQPLGNIALTESFGFGVGIGAGYLLGKAIAYGYLKNHGKQQAITFVTGENIDL